MNRHELIKRDLTANGWYDGYHGHHKRSHNPHYVAGFDKGKQRREEKAKREGGE